jgi:pyridoxine 5-phosphate synthase
MRARLGVNIDHVATLRQQRGESYPSIAIAAEVSLKAGADQITIHLREDRRHIQDADVPVVHEWCRKFNKPLNLEMGCTDEMVAIAIKEKPEWICLVPEKREERTTEGGLSLAGANFQRVARVVEALRVGTPATKISLFIEADAATIAASQQLAVHAVEIHTGDYARDFIAGKSLDHHLKMYAEAHKAITALGRGFHAGHGLTDRSVVPLVEQGLFAEYNIGHWIISEAVFRGLGPVVSALKEKL